MKTLGVLRYVARVSGSAVLVSIGMLLTAPSVSAQVKTEPAITAADIRERLAILASDSLEGRRSGLPGAEKAARYISMEFRRIGLTAIDSTKSFLEPFSFTEHLDSIRSIHTSTENVVGFLPGTDPLLSSQVIIVGAHYDHLGHGGRYALDTNSEIHYGADDNASGATGVLELAEYFATHPTSLKRSVLFISFSGEEEGLYGSNYYVNHPLVPLQKTFAMINMDMIGRLSADSILIVEGVGSSPQWASILGNLNTPKKFNLRLKQGGMGPSDHMSFYLKGLPVLFLFTGFHPDYHKSSDTPDKINAEGEARILDMTAGLIARLANDVNELPYTKAQEDTSQKATAFHVYVGGVPDYGYEGDGVRISVVTEHSPAEKAGFRANDVIVEFGGKKIKNIYDYTDALSKYKPGDVVAVALIRGAIKIELPVTLGSRGAH